MRSHQLPYYATAPSHHHDDNAKDKLRRYNYNPHSASSFPSRRFLLVFSAVCLLIALFTLIRAFSATPPPPRTLTVYRCGRAEDSLRTHLASSRGVEAAARPKVVGIVGVQTGFGSASAEKRAALRSTWFPADTDGLVSLEHGTGLAFRFVIGRTKNPQNMSELRKEAEMYHDFMFIDIDEDHTKLPQKTLAYFKAAFDLFDADFYVKADDDIYLRPDRLATLLAKDRVHRMTYIGCMKKGPVITDPKMQWYESKGDLLGTEYFLHAYGPIYALSSDVVSSLAAAKNDSLRMFSNEDVTIGSWMLSMNVDHEDNKAICDPTCTATSIAVWTTQHCSGKCNPVEKIRGLHNSTMCTKTPTLPAEEEEEE